MWVIVRQEDWVGGEDVIGVVGPLATEAEGRVHLARMQEELDGRPFREEQLWLLRLEPVE